MSAPGHLTTLGVIVAENDDGVWCTQVQPTTHGLPIEFYQGTGQQAAYQAARRASWSQADLGTLVWVWTELSRRASIAMKARTDLSFWIGRMTT